MSITKYDAFLRTVELGSFTKAAESLGYTQSNVSQMISSLEGEWGVSLLTRDRSGVTISSEGLVLLPHIREVCNAQLALNNALGDIHGLHSGLIRVGAFSSVAVHWLPGLIKAFQASYPNVEFEVLNGNYTQVDEWLAHGRADCGFLRFPAGEGLDAVFLQEDPLLAILPEGHPLAEQEVFPVERLGEEPFVLMQEGTENQVDEIFRRHGVRPDIRYHAWDDYAAMAMVESGLGISILPEMVLHRTGFRIARRPLSVPACRRLGIGFRDRRRVSGIMTRFLRLVEQQLGQGA